MAGLKVKVLERRPIVGGAAVTEEFHPGFRNSVAAYTVSLLNPKVIADLRLHEHGLTIVERRAQNFLPAPDGRYLLAADGQTERQVAKFSSADAERYGAFNRELDASADLLRELVLQAPPNLTARLTLRSLRRNVQKAGRVGNRLRRLSTENLRTLLDLFTKSAADYLEGWFEGDLVKALFGFDAIVGNYASPYTPGHRLCAAASCLRRGERQEAGLGPCDRRHGRDHAGDGARGARPWRRDRDRCAGARGAGREGPGGGVVLADGRIIRSAAVAANVNPKAPLYRDDPGRRARPGLPAPHAATGAAAPAPSG